jgi:hypothetical protein
MLLTNKSTLSHVLYNLLADLFDLVNAHLTLYETGGTITTDGTEQVLWLENAPLGNQEARTFKIDLDNMVGGDTVVVKVYHRVVSGGGLQQENYVSYTGADGGLANGSKIAVIALTPNRFGVQVTLQRTGGVDHAFTWEVFTEA